MPILLPAINRLFLLLLLVFPTYAASDQASDGAQILQRTLQQAQEAQQRAEKIAQEQALEASVNRALAHQEKSLALLEPALNTQDSGDFQRALLHALQAQRQPLESRQGLQPRALSR
jgi:hypothetical protein